MLLMEGWSHGDIAEGRSVVVVPEVRRRRSRKQWRRWMSRRRSTPGCCGPWAIISMRRAPESKQTVGTVVDHGRGNSLGEKMAVVAVNVEPIPPHMTVANKGLGEMSAERVYGVAGGLIVALNVVGWSGAEWR